MRSRHDRGFTLIELLVAMTLISMVMAGAYIGFSSTIRQLRIGEADLQTFQDARTGLTIMTQEIRNIVPGTGHLIEGTSDELLFYSVTTPMHAAEEQEAQLMQIRYRLNRNSHVVIREERTIEGGLPARTGGDDFLQDDSIELGSTYRFELAENIAELNFRYVWHIYPDDNALMPATETGAAPPEITVSTVDELPLDTGLPQAIVVSFAFRNEESRRNRGPSFTETVVFRGPTDLLDDEDISSALEHQA